MKGVRSTWERLNEKNVDSGSTFKTFLYTAAIDNGYGPCDKMVNVPVSINYEENGEQKTWSPGNASGVFTGDTVTLK